MKQFRIVQLERYSSAMTHYIEHKQLIPDISGKKPDTGNCPLYRPWSGWGVGYAKPQWN